MADIDLIPHDYRKWQEQRMLMRNYGIAILVINALLLGAGLLLGQLSDRTQTHIAGLKAANAITEQQQTQLQQLEEQEAEYKRRLSLLRGLRAGAAIDEIFTMIDRSLVDGDLWFLDWSFRRAGVIVDGEQRGIETGYFIIVDDDPLRDRNLEVETHMTIHGQAKDHQALSRFVRALFEQDGIDDVNVRRTSQTDYADRRVVEFDLTIILKSTLRRT